MKRYRSSDERDHSEWTDTLPDGQTKTAPPIQISAPLKDVAPQMKAGPAVILVGIFAVPTLFLSFFDYQLYFLSITHVQALIAAGVLTPVCIALILKLRTKAKQKYLIRQTQGGMSLLVGIVIVPFLLLYGWLLMLFSGALLLPGTSLDSKVYMVEAIATSSVKGFQCRPEMTLKAWPGLFDAKFCAENFTPPIQVGEPVVVRGYFSKRAVYVLNVSRPS